MDKETLSHYGWIVILVLILAVLLALATPFGSFIAEGFKATYAGFGMVSDNAMNITDIVTGKAELRYYQPYRYENEYGEVTEVVFHKDGTYDMYWFYCNEGDVYKDMAEYHDDGTFTWGGGLTATIAPGGTSFTDEDGTVYTLNPKPVHYIYYGQPYKLSTSWGYEEEIIFNEDGSVINKVNGATTTYPANYATYGAEEYQYNTGSNGAVYPNGMRVVYRGYLLSLDCSHENTEIRDKTDSYTGDEYCKDCDELIKEGSPMVPGLYDKDWNLVADWDTLVNEYGVDFSRDDSFSEGYAGELHRVMKNNVELQTGVTLLMSDELTHIGSYSLYSDSHPTYINRIIIGKNVKSIGAGAFIDFETLTRVDIPDGLETIGWGAFMGCSGLTEINVPESVTTLAAYAFSGCTNLTKVNIPNNITEVSLGLFEGCASLSNIYLREGITTIHEYAFRGCTSLRTINIPSTVTAINNDAFSRSGLVSIVIPNGITEVSESLFYGCTNLSSVTLPDTVTRIGQSAFSSCTSLRTLDLPDGVTYIADYAFTSCGLTSLDIPDGVTTILNYTFKGSKNLKTVKLPSNLVRINFQAFADCGLESIVIPAKTEEFAKEVFKNCTKLTNVVFEDPEGWKVNTAYAFGNYTAAKLLDLSSPSQNGYYLRSTYLGYFWKNVS